jgi:hypothetical protein
MILVYKIYVPYDGFSPAQIPKRSDAKHRIRLVWKSYLDEVEEDDEVWVHFRIPRGRSAVYCRGYVDEIDRDEEVVWLRVTKYDLDGPIVDNKTSARIEAEVSRTRRQVFLFAPKDFPDLDPTTSAYAAAPHGGGGAVVPIPLAPCWCWRPKSSSKRHIWKRAFREVRSRSWWGAPKERSMRP